MYFSDLNLFIMKTLYTLLFVLLSFGSFAQTTPQSSADVLKAACAKAKSEHKNVILMFHASWCGWCHKMEASFNDDACKKFFDDNYVIAYIDVMEHAGKENLQTPGGMDVMKTYGGNDKTGLPYWLILDAKGKMLGNSLMPAGTGAATAADNVGCPASDKEVAYFIGLLKSTSGLSDGQLAIIKARFLKNQPVSAAN